MLGEGFAESEGRELWLNRRFLLGVGREKFLFFMNPICFFIVFHVDNCDIADGFRHVF